MTTTTKPSILDIKYNFGEDFHTKCFVIHLQWLENYGDSDNPSFRWKGGESLVFWDDNLANIYARVADFCANYNTQYSGAKYLLSDDESMDDFIYRHEKESEVSYPELYTLSKDNKEMVSIREADPFPEF